MDVTQVLLSAQSPDAKLRKHAEESLQQFQEQNLPVFLLSLSTELANDAKPSESRRLAGIILKNSLDAKDSIRKEQLTVQWVNMDPSIKNQIKEALLRTLPASVSEVRHTSSQVIAKVASIEIPRHEWDDLIARLLSNMTQPDVGAPLKQGTLQALGYVCEEISPRDLEQTQVNAVLTAVVRGMSQDEQNFEVRLAAIRSLYNALDFAQTNFANEMERNYIMNVICEAAVAKEMEIRQAAFECLVSICSTYYEFLQPYIETIYRLTENAVRVDQEPVALQAIEFWSSVCDEEMLFQDEYAGSDTGSSVAHFHFIEKALPSLSGMLLETLLKQEEDQDQDDSIWNLSMAGGTCLGLVARTIGDAVVPLVMPFVESNIVNPDWRHREAATFAFGSIIEGPSPEKLAPLVHTGLNFLLTAMRDQNVHVKDTTAWTLGKIFEILHNPDGDHPVVNNTNLPSIMSVLLESMKDAPNVADKVCGAIYNLALGYEESESGSSVLSPYFSDTIASLLFAADRKDANNLKLRASAYETLNQVVRSCNINETSQLIGQLLHAIMSRLAETVELQIISTDDREKQADYQALLCGVLQVIVQKLSASGQTKPMVLQVADQMMLIFLKVFGCHSSTVHEEALLAIGALAYATGPQFEKYMPEFYKYLEMGLQNFEEYQVCAIAVGVVGDICRAVDEKILPFCDGIMTHLLKNLSNPILHRSVKPPIFICFGDIALAIGVHFEKYLAYAMPMLQGAADLCSKLDAEDEDMVDYGNHLRCGIFEAYSGILQGFKNTKAELMVPHAHGLLQFIEAIWKDKERDEKVAKAAIAAMGDLADALGANLRNLLQGQTFHVDFLRECFASDDDLLKETATWTQGMLSRVLVS